MSEAFTSYKIASLQAKLDLAEQRIAQLEGREVSEECLNALRNYSQADMDGIFVTVSRKALEMAIEALSTTEAGE